MRFGIFIPPFGPCADVATLATLAALAEEAGWDGFFLWNDVTINTPTPRHMSIDARGQSQ